MSKRFTETEKWNDLWFRNLDPISKLVWIYLCDNCDQAGVIELDYEAFSFFIGKKIDHSIMVSFDKQLVQISPTKVFIKNFVKFQYGKLSDTCKPHMPVFRALEKHGIDYSSVIENENYGERVTCGMRYKIIERDGPICVYSERGLSNSEIAIDHIVPIAKGGTNDPSNLVVCDRVINGLKTDRTIDDFCEKYGFDVKAVKARIDSRISKPIKGLSLPFQRVLDKDKDKDKEKDMEKEAGTSVNSNFSDAFGLFWNSYPRHIAKPKAESAFRSALKKAPFEKIMAGLERSKMLDQWNKDEGKFIPHPASWLNGCRWEDEHDASLVKNWTGPVDHLAIAAINKQTVDRMNAILGEDE